VRNQACGRQTRSPQGEKRFYKEQQTSVRVETNTLAAKAKNDLAINKQRASRNNKARRTGENDSEKN